MLPLRSWHGARQRFMMAKTLNHGCVHVRTCVYCTMYCTHVSAGTKFSTHVSTGTAELNLVPMCLSNCRLIRPRTAYWVSMQILSFCWIFNWYFWVPQKYCLWESGRFCYIALSAAQNLRFPLEFTLSVDALEEKFALPVLKRDLEKTFCALRGRNFEITFRTKNDKHRVQQLL